MAANERDLLFMKPVFKGAVWGGRRLADDFGYDIPEGAIGECWGIAAHPHGTTTVADGPFAGRTLAELWERRRDLFGNLPGDRFPLLVKILDARDRLSVQVHPGDAYAATHEDGSLGKRECWYVLATGADARIVIGQHAHDRDEFAKMVVAGRWDDLLNVIPVRAGDFFAVDPGTVHAICGDTVVLETQQSSDITYRIYDYGRTETDGTPRELHLEKALDVIDYAAEPPATGAVAAGEVAGVTELWANPHFTVARVRATSDAPVTLSNPWPFLCMSVVAGAGEVELAAGRYALRLGDHLVAPASSGDLRVSGDVTLIVSHVQALHPLQRRGGRDA